MQERGWISPIRANKTSRIQRITRASLLASAMVLIFVRPVTAQKTDCDHDHLCSCLSVSPISLYGGQGAGLAISGKTLYIAENVNSWPVKPQGPFVLEVEENGDQNVITPPGLLGDVTALALDRDANLYVADGNGTGVGQPPGRNVVWRISRTGTVKAFVSVNNPTGLAFDSMGNLYVSSFADGAVYKFSPTGQLLGVPLSNLTGNTLPYGLAVDRMDNLYVAGKGNPVGSKIFKVTPSAIVSVFVDAAPLTSPSSLVFDETGNLFASYYDSLTILRIAPDGSYVTLPGGGIGDDAPNGLALDAGGDLFVSVNGGRTTNYPAVVRLRGLVPAR